MLSMVNEGYIQIQVICGDTDVFVILLHRGGGGGGVGLTQKCRTCMGWGGGVFSGPKTQK